MNRKRIIVFSSLFPSSVKKNAGLFIRERMFRVAKFADIEVVSPVPWFPGQGLIRLFKPDYRPMPAKTEFQNGITVHYPRFISIPGLFRNLDAKMMALACVKLLKKLASKQSIDILDSHFTYPDGLAATILAEKLNTKVCITLRGTEVPHSKDENKKQQLLEAWDHADQMISVSSSLKEHAVMLGADAQKFTVVGNGVDTEKFNPMPQQEARRMFGLSKDAKILITVGGLVERKGFHRVINCIPELIKQHPNLIYLIVGGASGEGNYEPELRRLVAELNIDKHVMFLGPKAPEEISAPLSCSDAFVLASANEGWANVILEAMACGLPVIATDVGGNAEVVANNALGSIVPFGDHQQLSAALNKALSQEWDNHAIMQYAQANHWNTRMSMLDQIYDRLLK